MACRVEGFLIVVCRSCVLALVRYEILFAPGVQKGQREVLALDETQHIQLFNLNNFRKRILPMLIDFIPGLNNQVILLPLIPAKTIPRLYLRP